MRRCGSSNVAHECFRNEECLYYEFLIFLFLLRLTGLETLVHANPVGSQVIEQKTTFKAQKVAFNA